jgi:hypothetical protein
VREQQRHLTTSTSAAIYAALIDIRCSARFTAVHGVPHVPLSEAEGYKFEPCRAHQALKQPLGLAPAAAGFSCGDRTITGAAMAAARDQGLLAGIAALSCGNDAREAAAGGKPMR